MADITITIDNAQAQIFLDACHKAANARLTLDGQGPSQINPNDDFRGSVSINNSWADQGGSETDVEFGKRCLITMGKLLVKLVGQEQKDDDYRADVAAVTHEQYTVPEDLLT